MGLHPPSGRPRSRGLHDRTEEGRILRIFGVEPNKVNEVQGIIRKFALEAVIVEETEYELELEE